MTKHEQKLGQRKFKYFSSAIQDELQDLNQYPDSWISDGYLRKLMNNTTNDLKFSGLPSKLCTALSNVFIDRYNHGYALACFSTAHLIKSRIPFYKKLLTDPDITRTSLYILSILLNPRLVQQQLHLGINCVRECSKYQGFHLFDFLADAVDSAHDFVKSARKNLNSKHLKPTNMIRVKSMCPFLFSSQFEQVIGTIDWSMRDHQSGINSIVDKYLWLVNTWFNHFLVQNHVIKVNDNQKYELTMDSKNALCNPKESLKIFFAKNKMAYQPNASWSKVLSYGLKALTWINQHPRYNQYYGLAFAIEICSEGAYWDFEDYTDPEDNSTYSLGLVPIIHLSIILPLYVAILHDPFQKLGVYNSDGNYSYSSKMEFNTKGLKTLIHHLDNLEDKLRLLDLMLSSRSSKKAPSPIEIQKEAIKF